ATGGQANFQTRDIYTKTAGRQRFTRAAIYGEQDLGATTTIKPVACGTPGAVPVWGSANGGVKLAVCYQFGTVPPGPVWPLPPKWSIVPPNLDDAIIKDGTARADGGPPMLGSYPKGWLQDVRYRHPAAFKGIVPRSGFAAWFPLLDTTVSGPFKPVKIWLPLPPELGLHHPDFLYQKHTPTTFPVYAHDGTNTQTSQRTSRVTTDPQFGAVTVFDTLQAVHPKTGLFPETSQAASKSMLDPNGHRWNTNVGTTAKCWNGIFESQAHYPGTAPGGLSADWCPGALEGWAATSKAMEYNGNFLICNPAYESSQDKVGQILATFLNPKSVLELGVCAGIEKVKDAVLGGICCTCEGATFGTVQCCEKSCGEYVADVLGQAELACLIKQFMAQLTDYFPNSDHWPQVGGKVPFVGVVRNQSTSAIGPRATSFMTWGDFVLADAHQGNDWNWEFETHEVIDPGYRRFASVSVNGLLQPRKIEHEMEFQIAMGDWDSSASLPNPHYDWTVAQYFFGPSPKQVNLDLEWLGQLFPADQCDKHGILRDDTPKYSFVEKETWPGRTTPYNGHNIKCRTTWPEHFGRGNFTPFLEPALKVGMDYPINKLVPIAPSVLPTGVPFRRGFLGDVILDCGHPRGSGDFPAEIHPPHVLWTQFPAQTTYTIGGGYTYAEYSVFGWASENGFKEHSFDLWPPQPPGSTDPLLSAQLVVEGLEPGSFAYSTVPVEKLGVRIDNRQMTPAPTMKCSLEPKVFPNHVHCIYTAPNAGQTLGEDVERFLPKKATSRFEMRVRLGWKFKNGFVQ
ncbi:MAG: hypothetical protein LC118_08545, partial [Dehalococcoidia bacterium]|nr:hypothetical protein [Dehalococcoidia bacterium]